MATCARDQTARIFDLRMMRDICLLRGNEKDVSTLTWHPFHISLLTTGGSDGSIFHYLLDEPNHPPGTAATIPPYDSPDPSSAPAQTIYPAHRLQYAHDFAVWSLDWHPLGHILASGSNDRVTRFWTRARPGESECFNDRYHLGEAAAEAQGTWDRRGGRRLMREEEELEMEDEAEGLVDQQMPARQPVLPGIPGLSAPVGTTKDGTSFGGAQPRLPGMGGAPVLPSMSAPNGIATMDPNQFAALVAEGKIPLPPPIGGLAGSNLGLPPPPPLPANFDFSKMPPGMFPPHFSAPAGFPQPSPVSHSITLPGIGSDAGSGGSGSIRKRGPLPSQQESLMEEQRRGKYRTVR